MRSEAAPSLIPLGSQAYPDRVMELQYRHDWLANMTERHDDANAFYERAIGDITNGADVSQGSSPAHRPSALYLASNLSHAYPDDLGGWLEAEYGAGGNLHTLTVHAQCVDGAGSCKDPETGSLESRREVLRSRCNCAAEQRYRYQYDELNRLSEAQRLDGSHGSDWELAARQRYRYDSANQRTVKQTFEMGADPLSRRQISRISVS